MGQKVVEVIIINMASMGIYASVADSSTRYTCRLSPEYLKRSLRAGLTMLVVWSKFAPRGWDREWLGTVAGDVSVGPVGAICFTKCLAFPGDCKRSCKISNQTHTLSFENALSQVYVLHAL